MHNLDELELPTARLNYFYLLRISYTFAFHIHDL